MMENILSLDFLGENRFLFSFSNEWTSAFMAKKPKTTKTSGALRLVAAVLWVAALSSFVAVVFLFVMPSPSKHVDTPRTCGPYLTTPGCK